MVVLYLPIQSKSEGSSPSLVCFLMLFNNHISFLLGTIQLRFTNTSTRSTTIAIAIKSNGTKSTSSPYNLSLSYKDRRSNKVNSISFIKSFQIIIILYRNRLVIKVYMQTILHCSIYDHHI